MTLKKNNSRGSVNLGKLPTYLGYQSRQAQAAVWRDFPRLMNEVGITPGEFGLLTLIDANSGINQISLAKVYQLDKSTLSYAINRLVKRDLISRTRDSNDKRHYALWLTEIGRKTLDQATEKVEDQERTMDAVLEPGEREKLLDMLQRISRAFES